jgi:hypothetical protein
VVVGAKRLTILLELLVMQVVLVVEVHLEDKEFLAGALATLVVILQQKVLLVELEMER